MAKNFQYGLGGFLNGATPDLQAIFDRLTALSLETITVQVENVDYATGAILGKVLGLDANQIGENSVQALPLFTNIKNYPLKNETVICISSINYNYQVQPNSTSYYYISPVNLWASQNTNPLPLPQQNVSSSTEGKSLTEIEAGSSNKSQNTPPQSFKPGTYFNENGNILPLYSFEGDVIVEGRFGNSVRLGSTNIDVETTTTTEKQSKSFSTSTNFILGSYNIPLDFNSKLSYLNQEVEKYSTGQDSINVTVTIEAGESLVTNPNNLAKGELAKLRINTVKNTLQNYYFLKSNIKESIKIGTTPYTQGIDNPNDPKYTPEQYTTVTVYVEKTIVINTDKNSKSLNSWSSGSFSKNNGDPITIIRNGQTINSFSDLTSTIENINHDPSSIWLTSTQKLPISGSSTSYLSYGEFAPTSLNQYSSKPQIILNSGRLVFNSTLDHILLSSKTSINLNSVNSVNVDTNNFVVQSAKVYLGDSEDSLTQPVVLGDDLVSLLTDILSDLNTLTRSLQNQVGVPEGTPLAPTSLKAQLIADKIPNYKRRVSQLLSNTTRTAI